jgi:3-hydroxymyristoyl/3-hydroxydecanoyl-(acyl carrier protein) dehydratase
MKFRLVDRILAWEPQCAIRGIKNVSFEEYELRTPLGYSPYLPESLILESLFQLVNWMVILSTDYRHTCLGAQLDKAQFIAPLRPGSRMNMDIKVVSWRDDSAIVEGTVFDGRETVVVVERCLAAFVPLVEYYDPDDLRVLYSEIYRPDSLQQPGATSCLV